MACTTAQSSVDLLWYFIALLPWPVEAEGSNLYASSIESTLIRHIIQNRLPYTQVFCFLCTSPLQDLSVYKILPIQMLDVYFEYPPLASKSSRMFCSSLNPSDTEPHLILARDGLFLYRPKFSYERLTPAQIEIEQSSVSNCIAVSRFEHRVHGQIVREPRRSFVRSRDYFNSIIPRSRITSIASEFVKIHKRASSSAIYTISTSFRE